LLRRYKGFVCGEDNIFMRCRVAFDYCAKSFPRLEIKLKVNQFSDRFTFFQHFLNRTLQRKNPFSREKSKSQITLK